MRDKSLADDQKKYPFVADPEGLNSRPATVVDARFAALPDWQLQCERALVEMQAYRDDTGAAVQAAAPDPGVL